MSTKNAQDLSWLHPYLRGDTWQVYWMENGKKIQRSLKVKNKRQVNKALQDLAREILDQESAITLENFAADFFTSQCAWITRRTAMGHETKQSTRTHYRTSLTKYILPAHGKMKLATITEAMIEDLGASLEVSNSYRNEIMRAYRIILDEAARAKLIPPLGKIDRFSRQTKPKDILSEEALEKLFPADREALRLAWKSRYIYEPAHGGLMWGSLFMLMVSAGLRSGEVRAIELQHLFLDDGVIVIGQAFDKEEEVSYLKKASSQDKRVRIVPIPARTIEALQWWLEVRPGETPFLFEFMGRHIQRRLILDRFHLGLAKAGITGNLTPHSLRYTYNTRMETKLPGDVLRLIIGHKSEAMTQHYSKPIIAERVKELSAHKDAVEEFWRH